MATTRTRRRRATAPKPVRQVARAARLDLEKLAEAIIAGHPAPERPRDQVALLHWLGHSVRNAHPAAAMDKPATIMSDRLQEMADGGDATATAMLKAEVDLVGLNMARIALALVGPRGRRTGPRSRSSNGWTPSRPRCSSSPAGRR